LMKLSKICEEKDVEEKERRKRRGERWRCENYFYSLSKSLEFFSFSSTLF
jgi:hypothetical protein